MVCAEVRYRALVREQAGDVPAYAPELAAPE